MRTKLQMDRQSEGPKKRWENYRKNVVANRQCAACDSKTTKLNKKGFPRWHKHGSPTGRSTYYPQEDEYWLCSPCYNHYVMGPAKSFSRTLNL